MSTRSYTTEALDPDQRPAGPVSPTGAGSVQTLALGGALAGALGIGLAIGDAVKLSSTTVSEDVWSYPWTGTAFVVTTLAFSALHVLFFGLLLGLRRSGLTGPTRGLTVAMAGIVVVFLAEFGSIAAADFDVDSPTVSGVLIPMFGLGGLAAAIGLIVAGCATLRAGLWDGPGRLAPLGMGIVALLPTLLGPTDLFPYAFIVYGLGLLTLGVALARR